MEARGKRPPTHGANEPDEREMKRLRIAEDAPRSVADHDHGDADSDDSVDMFSDSPIAVNSKPSEASTRIASDAYLADSCADADGYYVFRLGDLLVDRY